MSIFFNSSTMFTVPWMRDHGKFQQIGQFVKVTKYHRSKIRLKPCLLKFVLKIGPSQQLDVR